MNTPYDLKSLGAKLVYVKTVAVDDLPADVQEQAEGHDQLFAVHRSDGAPLALVADRRTAFHLARQNDLEPVSIH